MPQLDSTVLAAIIGGIVTAITVSLTVAGAVGVAVYQLSHDRQERAKDRALQSKRDLLIAGISSANEAMRAMSVLSDPEMTVTECGARFQQAAAAMSAGSAVADVEVLRKARDFTFELAQSFMEAMLLRSLMSETASPAEWLAYQRKIMELQMELQPAYASLVAAVRRDLGIENSTDTEIESALRLDGDRIEIRARARVAASLRAASA